MITNFARILSGRGAWWKLGADLLGRLLQYILLWVAARQLAQADFGDFTFALSIGFMLAQVADFGLQLYVQRELARLVIPGASSRPYFTDEKIAGRLVGGGLAIKALLSLVAMLLIAGSVLIEPVGNKGALLLVGLSMVLGTGLDYLSYCFRALGNLRYEAFLTLVSRAANLVLGVSLLLWGAGVWGLALSGNLAMLVTLILSYRLLTRYVLPIWRPDWAYWRRSLGMSEAGATAVGLGIMFSMISFRVDNLLIPPMSGRESLATYNIAYKLFEPSLIVPGVVLAATFPLLAQSASVASLEPGRLLRLLGHTMLVLAGLGAAAIAVLVLLAAPVISLLYGSSYVASVPVLQILALGCLPMYLNYGLTHALIAVDRPRLYAAFNLAALFVNVVANLVLIPVMGVSGAALATVLTEVALFSLCASAIMRHLASTHSAIEPIGVPSGMNWVKPKKLQSKIRNPSALWATLWRAFRG